MSVPRRWLSFCEVVEEVDIWTPLARSAVDGGHVVFVVAFAGGRSEVVEPFDLFGAQLDAIGGGVLLDAGHPLGAGDRGDVVTLREQPGQRDLRRCGTCLGGDSLDLVDDAQVALEVLADEARIGLAPVVIGNVCGGTDFAGEEAVTQRRVGHEADPQFAQQRQQLEPPRRGSTASTPSAAR